MSEIGGIGISGAGIGSGMNMDRQFGAYRGQAAKNHEELYDALSERIGESEAARYTKVSKEEAAAAKLANQSLSKQQFGSVPTGSAKAAREFVGQYSRQMTNMQSAAADVLALDAKSFKDPTTFEDAAGRVTNLVDSYNRALEFLNDNADKGSGLIRQMSNMLHLPISEKSLGHVGIGVAKDGTMSLNKDKFIDSLKRAPELAKSLISGSYSLAQGLTNDAGQGLRISSGKLTDGLSGAGSWSRNGTGFCVYI